MKFGGQFVWKVVRLSRDAELRVCDFWKMCEKKKKDFFLEGLEEGSPVWRKLFWKVVFLRKAFPGFSRDVLILQVKEIFGTV